MSPKSATSDDRTSQAVFWGAVAVSAVNAVYAVLSARGLVYDGAFYLLAIAAHRDFHLIEPARLSVQSLQQLPAVLGARFGITNLWTLGQLFSLGMFGWPVVLTAFCWFALPRGEKKWIAGPLINLVFAIPPASFIGISEGAIASCLLWLAVLLVTFRLAQPLGSLAALVASVACATAHESVILGLVLIGWLAAAQYGRSRGVCRLVSAAIVVISALAVLYMARWIVAPRSTIERADFLVSLLGGFLGSPRVPNLPALASVIGAICVLIALFRGGQSKTVAIVGAIAVLACGAVFVAIPAALASPGRFFAARGLPVVTATVLAASFAYLRRRELTLGRFMTWPVLTVFVALILSQVLMQAVATNLWRSYVRDLRVLVATHQGAISHEQALAALDTDSSRFRRELLQTWSVQPLSILLAPGGHVTAIVQPAETERWVPYRLQEPRTLPRMPQLDWSHFPQPHKR